MAINDWVNVYRCKHLKAAVGNAQNLLWATNLVIVDGRIISSQEPIKSPETTWLQLSWKLIATISVLHTTVAISPAVSRSTPLRLAAVKQSYATARHQKVELPDTNVSSGVGGLDNHFLSSHSGVGECELVAFAARIWFAKSGKAIRQSVADDHRLVIVASRGGSAIANALSIFVNDVVAIS